MSLWNRLIAMRKGSLLVACSLMVCVMVTACSPEKEKPQSVSESTTSTVQSPSAEPIAEPAVSTAVPDPSAVTMAPVTPVAVGMPESGESAAVPTSVSGVAADGVVPETETPRSRFHTLCEKKQWNDARTALEAHVAELESTQERKVVHWRVYQLARDLDQRRSFHAAVLGYQCFVGRFGDSHRVPDALNNLGHCCLEIGDYSAAAQAWQQLVEEHDDSRHASWAWRQLAEAQTHQGTYDDALATLAIMADKYAGTRFEEYARMRMGHVLSAAGKTAEAREAHAKFLKAYPSGKYSEEVRHQMKADELIEGSLAVSGKESTNS